MAVRHQGDSTGDDRPWAPHITKPSDCRCEYLPGGWECTVKQGCWCTVCVMGFEKCVTRFSHCLHSPAMCFLYGHRRGSFQCPNAVLKCTENIVPPATCLLRNHSQRLANAADLVSGTLLDLLLKCAPGTRLFCVESGQRHKQTQKRNPCKDHIATCRWHSTVTASILTSCKIVKSHSPVLSAQYQWYFFFVRLLLGHLMHGKLEGTHVEKNNIL